MSRYPLYRVEKIRSDPTVHHAFKTLVSELKF